MKTFIDTKLGILWTWCWSIYSVYIKCVGHNLKDLPHLYVWDCPPKSNTHAWYRVDRYIYGVSIQNLTYLGTNVHQLLPSNKNKRKVMHPFHITAHSTNSAKFAYFFQDLLEYLDPTGLNITKIWDSVFKHRCTGYEKKTLVIFSQSHFHWLKHTFHILLKFQNLIIEGI